MNIRWLVAGIFTESAGIFFAIVPIPLLCNCHDYLVPFFLLFRPQGMLAQLLLAGGLSFFYVSKRESKN